MKLFPFMCFCCIVQLNSEAFDKLYFKKLYWYLKYWFGYYVMMNDYGYIVAGATNQFGVGGYNAYLIKNRTIQATPWTKTFGIFRNEDSITFTNQRLDILLPDIQIILETLTCYLLKQIWYSHRSKIWWKFKYGTELWCSTNI